MNLIIVICRNGLELSKNCVGTLLEQWKWPAPFPMSPRVLVIDNASSDGTREWLRQLQAANPNIFGMSFDRVQSVSTLWNRGLFLAQELGLGHALVVNNDTEILPQTFDALARALRMTSAAMVTCVSRREKEEVTFDSAKVEGSELRPHPDFSCFMISIDAWRKIGGFDEGFIGAYYEDNDFHVRLHQAGMKALCLDMPFWHKGSGTLALADPDERRRIESNAASNKIRFHAKHGCYPGTEGYARKFEGTR